MSPWQLNSNQSRKYENKWTRRENTEVTAELNSSDQRKFNINLQLPENPMNAEQGTMPSGFIHCDE